MTNVKDIIIELKEVREAKGLSFGDILDLMEKNGDYILQIAEGGNLDARLTRRL